MISILFFAVCFLASIGGAVCGIGGGVIIKPTLDAFGVMSVSAISFLSGCTVLAMSAYSVLAGKVSGSSKVEGRTGFPLAAGAAVGGILGKQLFQYMTNISVNPDKVGSVQAVCLLIVTVGTLIYTLKKDKIKTLQVKDWKLSLIIGMVLGLMSAFLGIGGGPINLVVLYYFFSMETKTAAENSLYIIFFSQLASFLMTLFTGTVPDIGWATLLLMVTGGILGGVFGRKINRKIEAIWVERLFIILMILMILINIYNIFRFANTI
jgi:uncharacterized membrane protein YfcA